MRRQRLKRNALIRPVTRKLPRARIARRLLLCCVIGLTHQLRTIKPPRGGFFMLAPPKWNPTCGSALSLPRIVSCNLSQLPLVNRSCVAGSAGSGGNHARSTAQPVAFRTFSDFWASTWQTFLIHTAHPHSLPAKPNDSAVARRCPRCSHSVHKSHRIQIRI